jgi:hypothetical protein
LTRRAKEAAWLIRRTEGVMRDEGATRTSARLRAEGHGRLSRPLANHAVRFKRRWRWSSCSGVIMFGLLGSTALNMIVVPIWYERCGRPALARQ